MGDPQGGVDVTHKSNLRKKLLLPYNWQAGRMSGLKRKLDRVCREVEKEVSSTKDCDADALSRALIRSGIDADSIVAQVVEFLDDLDEQGFAELTEFEDKTWPHFVDSPAVGAAAAALPEGTQVSAA